METPKHNNPHFIHHLTILEMELTSRQGLGLTYLLGQSGCFRQAQLLGLFGEWVEPIKFRYKLDRNSET